MKLLHGWKTLNKIPVINLEERMLLDIADNKEQYGRDNLKFIVGGDSQFHKTFIKYTYVFVILRDGKGGIGYFKDVCDTNISISRRQRLFKETYDAVDIAIWLNPILEKLGFKIDEVHTDLNPPRCVECEHIFKSEVLECPICGSTNIKTYGSSSMVKSCLGYISGMGFDGKCKPDSWVSYEIADRFTK